LSSPPGPANQSLKLRLIYAGSYREQLLQIKQFLRSSLHRNAPSPLEAMTRDQFEVQTPKRCSENIDERQPYARTWSLRGLLLIASDSSS